MKIHIKNAQEKECTVAQVILIVYTWGHIYMTRARALNTTVHSRGLFCLDVNVSPLITSQNGRVNPDNVIKDMNQTRSPRLATHKDIEKYNRNLQD